MNANLFGEFSSRANRGAAFIPVLSALFLASSLAAQDAAPNNAAPATAVSVTQERPPDEIGPNSRTWFVKSPSSAPADAQADGAAEKPARSRVEEIATGMNFWTGQKWAPSDPSFEVAADSFVATRLQYLATINFNLNTVSAVTIVTRDGVTIRSTPVAIALFDSTSGASIIIGSITNCSGVLVSSNKILFENAFHGISADLIYTIDRATFEQDAVIRARLDPADYGFPRESSRLQVLTELYDAPIPERIRRPIYVEEREEVRNAKVSPDLIDEVLGFGEFVLAAGRAFSSETDPHSTAATAPVAKEIRNFDQRTILVESVDYVHLQEQLQALPEPVKKEARLWKKISPKKGNVAYAAIPRPSGKKDQAKVVTPKTGALMAYAKTEKRKGVTIDYIAVPGSTVSSTMFFSGDCTFSIVGAVICNGPVVLEGGAVLKFKHYSTYPTGYAYIKINNTLTCKSTSYRPTIFTAADDGSVGQSVSTGTFQSDGYANPALWLYYGSPSLSNLRFSYCQEAVRFEGSSGTTTFSHAQLVNCIRGIVVTGCGCGSLMFLVNNSLFAKVSYPITVNRATSVQKFVNCTIDCPSTSSCVATSTSSTTCYFYNSILVNGYVLGAGSATVAGDYNGFSFFYNQ